MLDISMHYEYSIMTQPDMTFNPYLYKHLFVHIVYCDSSVADWTVHDLRLDIVVKVKFHVFWGIKLLIIALTTTAI